MWWLRGRFELKKTNIYLKCGFQKNQYMQTISISTFHYNTFMDCTYSENLILDIKAAISNVYLALFVQCPCLLAEDITQFCEGSLWGHISTTNDPSILQSLNYWTGHVFIKKMLDIISFISKWLWLGNKPIIIPFPWHKKHWHSLWYTV